MCDPRGLSGGKLPFLEVWLNDRVCWFCDGQEPFVEIVQDGNQSAAPGLESLRAEVNEPSGNVHIPLIEALDLGNAEPRKKSDVIEGENVFLTCRNESGGQRSSEDFRNLINRACDIYFLRLILVAFQFLMAKLQSVTRSRRIGLRVVGATSSVFRKSSI